MSIPPLVCSTPPPPDQCEDDKDPEDFDLSYNNLSQEDDDENNDYNYGNFPSYSHYQSATNNKPLEIKHQEITNTKDAEVTKEIFMQYEHCKGTEQISISHDQFVNNDINENKFKCEEDINIEDLNLELDQEIVTNVIENSEENKSVKQNTDSLKDQNIPCNSNDSSQDEENVTDPPVGLKESNVYLDVEILEQSSDIKTIYKTSPEDVDLNSHFSDIDVASPKELHVPTETIETLQSPDEVPEDLQQPLSNESELPSYRKKLDDFGDFDDFQFANNEHKITTFVDSSNPWDSIDNNELDFGNFTANFEENKGSMEDSSHLESGSICNSDQLEHQAEGVETKFEDDEFGDFDDFKSSAGKMEYNEVDEKDLCHELPVLNLQSSDNDHHIMESITKVLTSVFIEEISEPDNSFDGKLESLLSETWGHLMETDERQPYIINWNNSLGQKTLLKALCIDSRNILFGPKWCSQMPKYAANLSVAPLQPQKQVCPSSNVTQSELAADNASSKPTTWSDPFASDGQESCQENESSNAPSRPTDLDVFQAAIPTKPEKIYSTTLSVQPIRQINLPDTHIFTPTDSEIPRSKTIHYDRSPTVLLPQPVVSDSKITTDNPTTQRTDVIVETGTVDDSEYWEFQDFKSTSDPTCLSRLSHSQTPQDNNFKTATTVNALPKPSIAYQTQLLQPIKVEPAIPTLNWPDPGEVKVAYDDFTDFISISTPSTKTQDSTMQPPDSQETTHVNMSDNLSDLNGKTGDAFTEVTKPANEGFDDFDTFQSALPPKNKQNVYKTSPLGTLTNDYASPKSHNTKSEPISFMSTPSLNETSQNLEYNSNLTELTNKTPLPSSTQIQTSLLQPTPANSNTINTQNQRTIGQILQPLSLESYSQINWPSPGIDLQDLSRFNPVETLQSLKSDLSATSVGKVASPAHLQKNIAGNQSSDDDVWGEFVSSKPKQQQSVTNKTSVFAEDDEWTDFKSSPNVKPQNGLNTISLNVHTNSNIQKTVMNKFPMKSNPAPVDIPTLNYITPKSNLHKSYNDKHFQNL